MELTAEMIAAEPYAASAMKWKMEWLGVDKRGDLPPTIVILKADRELARVTAPVVDTDLAYQVAYIARQVFDPDVMILVTDAHMAVREIPPGMSVEEVIAQHSREFPKGSMQRACDEGGACERNEITDCVIVLRVDRYGNAKMATIPYSYHGAGTKFRWGHDLFPTISPHWGDAHVGGGMVATLNQIFATPKDVLSDPMLQAAMDVMGVDKGEQGRLEFHARFFVRSLRDHGFYATSPFDPSSKPIKPDNPGGW